MCSSTAVSTVNLWDNIFYCILFCIRIQGICKFYLNVFFSCRILVHRGIIARPGSSVNSKFPGVGNEKEDNVTYMFLLKFTLQQKLHVSLKFTLLQRLHVSLKIYIATKITSFFENSHCYTLHKLNVCLKLYIATKITCFFENLHCYTNYMFLKKN